MFKKIVEFFTGKKPESKFAHPLDAVTTPTVSAPYKLEPPAATTPVPVSVEPPAAPATKKRTFVKKPAVIKAPAEKKPRAKKTPQ